tara:strand:+ start:752 stop:1411 length:660 start_codon:yes stop_codon:yes gene_type:complete
MSNLNEKRVSELVKGNKSIESYIEVVALEKNNEESLNKLKAQIKSSSDRLIDSWVKSGAFALAVEKELANVLKQLKSEGLKITMKELIPLTVGSYSAFRRNVQIGNLTEKQVEAFRTAVHKDSTIAVQKASIIEFAKGKKKPKATPKKSNKGGQEEAKEGGQGDREQVFNYGGVKVDFVKKGNTKVIDFNGASPQDFDKAMKQFQMDIKLHNASVEKVK